MCEGCINESCTLDPEEDCVKIKYGLDIVDLILKINRDLCNINNCSNCGIDPSECSKFNKARKTLGNYFLDMCVKCCIEG